MDIKEEEMKKELTELWKEMKTSPKMDTEL